MSLFVPSRPLPTFPLPHPSQLGFEIETESASESESEMEIDGIEGWNDFEGQGKGRVRDGHE